LPTRPTLPLAAIVALVGLSLAASLPAQSLDVRPFRALSANVLGTGHEALELGFESRWGIRPVPLLSPARGTFLQAPILRYRMGLGRGEFAIGMPAYQWFNPEGATTTDDFGDASFFVTIEALRQHQRRPAFGVDFGTKLPVASKSTLVGTNETDVFAGIALSQAGPAHEFRLNLGVAILEDPNRDATQEDVGTYAIAGRHGRVNALLWEVWGQTPGSDPARNLNTGTLRVGYAHYGRRAIIDVSLLSGYVDNSGDLGITAGTTFLFGDGR